MDWYKRGELSKHGWKTGGKSTGNSLWVFQKARGNQWSRTVRPTFRLPCRHRPPDTGDTGSGGSKPRPLLSALLKMQTRHQLEMKGEGTALLGVCLYGSLEHVSMLAELMHYRTSWLTIKGENHWWDTFLKDTEDRIQKRKCKYWPYTFPKLSVYLSHLGYSNSVLQNVSWPLCQPTAVTLLCCIFFFFKASLLLTQCCL